MVKHIVMFDFKEENKEANINKAKEMLAGLLETVATLKGMEIGVNFSDEARAMDMSIYTTFEDRAGLEAYAIHPEHVNVVEFIKTVVNGSKVVDYTL